MRKLAAVLAAAVIAFALAACTPEEGDHLVKMNDIRAAHGAPMLNWEEAAYAKARSWSEHMADIGHLQHSHLPDGMPDDWRSLGENVAFGPTPQAALDAIYHSPAHRNNMLNHKFTRFAVGVIERHGTWWVTQVFIG
jgi:uncharacterized protein YkwD